MLATFFRKTVDKTAFFCYYFMATFKGDFMSQFVFDFDQFAAEGGVQRDLSGLLVHVKSRRFFDLATPDPEFSDSPGFTVRSDDQFLLPRSKDGKIEVARFFQHLQLFLTEGQQKGEKNGAAIYNEIVERGLPVLGPNVGQFLYEHQELIPVELRGNVALVFWGKVYRRLSDQGRCVWYLYWNGYRWTWEYGLLAQDYWSACAHAVLFAG